jgi:hypothetical protein
MQTSNFKHQTSNFKHQNNHMKKIIILYVSAFFLCTTTFNQESKINVGIEFSPTIRSLHGGYYSNDNYGLGYYAGLKFQYRIKGLFSFNSGIIYERKGLATKMDMMNEELELIGTTKMSINFDYIILPVLGSISNRKDFFHVTTGPFLGYLVSHIDKYTAVGEIPAGEYDMTKNTERLDFGWIFDVGFTIKLNNKLRLDLGIRENLGLANLGKLKTNSIGLRTGLKVVL